MTHRTEIELRLDDYLSVVNDEISYSLIFRGTRDPYQPNYYDWDLRLNGFLSKFPYYDQWGELSSMRTLIREEFARRYERSINVNTTNLFRLNQVSASVQLCRDEVLLKSIITEALTGIQRRINRVLQEIRKCHNECEVEMFVNPLILYEWCAAGGVVEIAEAVEATRGSVLCYERGTNMFAILAGWFQSKIVFIPSRGRVNQLAEEEPLTSVGWWGQALTKNAREHFQEEICKYSGYSFEHIFPNFGIPHATYCQTKEQSYSYVIAKVLENQSLIATGGDGTGDRMTEGVTCVRGADHDSLMRLMFWQWYKIPVFHLNAISRQPSVSDKISYILKHTPDMLEEVPKEWKHNYYHNRNWDVIPHVTEEVAKLIQNFSQIPYITTNFVVYGLQTHVEGLMPVRGPVQFSTPSTGDECVLPVNTGNIAMSLINLEKQYLKLDSLYRFGCGVIIGTLEDDPQATLPDEGDGLAKVSTWKNQNRDIAKEIEGTRLEWRSSLAKGSININNIGNKAIASISETSFVINGDKVVINENSQLINYNNSTPKLISCLFTALRMGWGWNVYSSIYDYPTVRPKTVLLFGANGSDPLARIIANLNLLVDSDTGTISVSQYGINSRINRGDFDELRLTANADIIISDMDQSGPYYQTMTPSDRSSYIIRMVMRLTRKCKVLIAKINYPSVYTLNGIVSELRSLDSDCYCFLLCPFGMRPLSSEGFIMIMNEYDGRPVYPNGLGYFSSRIYTGNLETDYYPSDPTSDVFKFGTLNNRAYRPQKLVQLQDVLADDSPYQYDSMPILVGCTGCTREVDNIIGALCTIASNVSCMSDSSEVGRFKAVGTLSADGLCWYRRAGTLFQRETLDLVTTPDSLGKGKLTYTQIKYASPAVCFNNGSLATCVRLAQTICSDNDWETPFSQLRVVDIGGRNGELLPFIMNHEGEYVIQDPLPLSEDIAEKYDIEINATPFSFIDPHLLYTSKTLYIANAVINAPDAYEDGHNHRSYVRGELITCLTNIANVVNALPAGSEVMFVLSLYLRGHDELVYGTNVYLPSSIDLTEDTATGKMKVSFGVYDPVPLLDMDDVSSIATLTNVSIECVSPIDIVTGLMISGIKGTYDYYAAMSAMSSCWSVITFHR